MPDKFGKRIFAGHALGLLRMREFYGLAGCIGSEFRRPFRPAGRVSTAAFYKTAFARSIRPQQPNLLKPSKP